MWSTSRLIQMLESVNPTAIDNDEGRPGELLAKMCCEAARRLRLLTFIEEQQKQGNALGFELDPNVVDLEELIGHADNGC